MRTENILCRKISVFEKNENGPLILLLSGKNAVSEGNELFEKTRLLFPEKAFNLAVFEAPEWDADYSPWATSNRTRSFAGNGAQTLLILRKALTGYLREYSDNGCFLAGYSLAGLFALWSLYETDLFDGCACCSGSLWYEGFTEYTSKRSLCRPGLVYLSLGGKETHASDPLLARIGIRTQEQRDILKEDRQVMAHTLEMNKGGHFADSTLRLAKGIAWLLREKSKWDGS